MREVLVAWAGLALLCAIAYLPNIRHGGFYLDDWSNAAITLQGAGGNLWSAASDFAGNSLYRPVLLVYVPFTYIVFGMHMALHLVWVTILALLAAGMLYGVLRTVEVPRLHAWLVSALTLLYPWYDSTRLWATGGQLTLSITIMLAGLWIALVGLSRRSWRWHACAALLYLVSILTYEITLPVIAMAGALYTARVGWRRARMRWGVDLLVVLAGGIWVAVTTTRARSSLAGDLSHLGEIVTSGGTLLGRTALPIGPQHTTLALGLLFAVLAAGLLAYMFGRRPVTDTAEWGLREWLLMAGAGLILAALGWAMLIPADPNYYTPNIFGVNNRINALAGIGLVVTIYGGFGVLGALIGRVSPRAVTLGVAVTLTMAAALGLANLHKLRVHTQIWNTAFLAEKNGLRRIHERFPRLAPGTTLFVSGYPANQTQGVTIFSSTWDLEGMVRTIYDDGTLSALPVYEGLRLACGREALRLEGEGPGGEVVSEVRYGEARLLDLATARRASPRNRRACRSVVHGFVPGPVSVSASY